MSGAIRYCTVNICTGAPLCSNRPNNDRLYSSYCSLLCSLARWRSASSSVNASIEGGGGDDGEGDGEGDGSGGRDGFGCRMGFGAGVDAGDGAAAATLVDAVTADDGLGAGVMDCF